MLTAKLWKDPLSSARSENLDYNRQGRTSRLAGDTRTGRDSCLASPHRVTEEATDTGKTMCFSVVEEWLAQIQEQLEEATGDEGSVITQMHATVTFLSLGIRSSQNTQSLSLVLNSEGGGGLRTPKDIKACSYPSLLQKTPWCLAETHT